MTRFPLLFLLISAFKGFSQSPGDAFFSQWAVHEIRLQFSQPGYLDSLKANYTLDAYMRCDITVDGQAFPQSGVKYKGNSSYNNSGKKKPLRIDFEEYTADQELDGMDKIVLNNAFKDPSFLREKLMLDFLNQHGIAAPRASFARVYLNDHYWGLYTVIEDVNKTFVKTRYDNKGGNLFKGDPRGTLTWKGPDQALYTADYELKTNETENDWSDLLRLLNALNNTPTAQLPDSLGRYLNVDSWMDYWAAHNLFVNLDSYIGSGHNYFLYHNTDTDLFEWITWDVNEAFGNFQMGMPLSNLKTLAYSFIPQPANQRPMMNKVWANTALRQQYADHLCTLLGAFSNAALDARIDSLAALVRPHVYEDSLKFYTNAAFEQNLNQDINQPPNSPGVSAIAGLKPFISARRAALLQQLAAVGCVATDTQEPGGASIHLFPNPAATYVSVQAPAGTRLRRLRLTDVSGAVVQTHLPDNPQQAELTVEQLPVGLYFLQIETDAGVFGEKVVVIR